MGKLLENPWVREALTALALFAATVLALLWLSDDAPLHPDSCRDILLARDLVEGGHLNLVGPISSFGRLYQGTLWSDFLALNWALGLGPLGMQVATWLLHGLAVATLYLGARYLGGRTLGLVVATLFLIISPVLAGHPVLFNPALMPLPLVAFHVAFALFLTRGGWPEALIASFFLAITIETHLGAPVLVPLLIFAVGVWSRRPWLLLPLVILPLPATLLILSPGTWLMNVEFITGELGVGVWLNVAGLLAVVTVLARRRLTRLSSTQRILLVAGVELLACAMLLLAGPMLGWMRIEPRYLLPFAPAVALLCGLVLDRLVARAVSARPSLATLLRGEWLALVLLLLGLPWLAGQLQRDGGDVRSPGWSLREVETLATQVRHRGYGHWQLRAHLQAPRFRELIGCLEALERQSKSPAQPSESNLIALRLLPAEAENLDPLHKELLPLGKRTKVLLQQSAPWVSRAGWFSVCLKETDNGEAESNCFDATAISPKRPATPGTRSEHSPYEGLYGEDALLEMLGHSATGLQASYELQVSPAEPGKRVLVSVLDDPQAACPWEISEVKGVPFSGGPLPATSVFLGPVEGESGHRGSIVVSKTVGHGTCTDNVDTVRFPPAILESYDEDRELRALLQLAPVDSDPR